MGSLVSVIAGIVHLVLLIYIFVLFARLILDYIPLFNREWRPKGFGLVVAEAVYTVTDPPIRFFRRIIPPLRIGGLSLDFGFALTMFVVLILMAIVRAIGGAAS
ncbi:YggT family protein [Microbacterium sp. M]|uniref:YggT family protein n=1 Tax=Microbacterium sp. M TaxID=3377125 RepID=UPI00386383DC